MSLDELELTLMESFDEAKVEHIHRLVQKQWWGGDRTLEDVTTMAENTSLMLGLWHDPTQTLAGFCRVLTDFAFRGTIYDVMVEEAWQGKGLGRILMDSVCEHPRMTKVSLIYLCAEEKLFPFYEKWGFQPYEGRAEWMLKTQRVE